MSAQSEDAGKLVLRLAVGAMVLLHGIAKLSHGVDGIIGMVTQAGLPGVFGYLVYIGEVLAPMLLILGLFTRPAALIVAINMLFAFYLVHLHQIFSLGGSGGWALELQGMFLFGALAVALLGAGRYSLGGAHGKCN